MQGTISVIASGWSLADIPFDRIPGLKVGVNDSAWRAQADLGVTMDRLFFEGRFNQLEHAFSPSTRRVMYYRAGIDKAGRAPGGWVRFDCDNESTEMSLEWAPRCRLNGLNSGICAINLAYRIAKNQALDRVILWGFDMCRSPDGRAYYHEPYPWAPTPATKPGKYAAWASSAFHKIAAQFVAAKIELLNASPPSAILGIRKVKPKDLLT
jgi:hypothetical protein